MNHHHRITWLFLAVLFAGVFANPASAYMGQRIIEMGANYFVFPIALVSIVLGLVAAIFQPAWAKGALYTAIVATAIFFVIRLAPTLESAIKSA